MRAMCFMQEGIMVRRKTIPMDVLKYLKDFEDPALQKEWERACLLTRLNHEEQEKNAREAETAKPDLGLMDVKEVAAALKVSEKTIRNWVSARKIPYVKLGGRVVFDQKKVRAWLDAKMVEVSGR